VSGNRGVGAITEPDRFLFARRTADPATVAPCLVNGNFFVGRTIAEGAELAELHALSTACAYFRVYFGNVLGAEHDRDSMGDR